MFLDFSANLLTFLASLDIQRIAPIGSMFAIVAAMTSTLRFSRRYKSTDSGPVAQQVLLIEGDTGLQLVSEEKDQIPSSHNPVANSPNTPGVTTAFGPLRQAQTMPMIQQTRTSYDYGLHCARGREALKFRAEGDTSMFFRSAKIQSESAQSSTHNLVSAVSGRSGDMVSEEAV